MIIYGFVILWIEPLRGDLRIALKNEAHLLLITPLYGIRSRASLKAPTKNASQMDMTYNARDPAHDATLARGAQMKPEALHGTQHTSLDSFLSSIK